jgi:hypothetical protein
MLGVLVRGGRVDDFRRLERENRVRIWRVRGVVSDHIPLSGDAVGRGAEHFSEDRIQTGQGWAYSELPRRYGGQVRCSAYS